MPQTGPRLAVRLAPFAMLVVLLASAHPVQAQGTAAPDTVLADTTAATGSDVAPAAPRPPSKLTVKDASNDAGRALELQWVRSPDDLPGQSLVTQYRLERASAPSGPWTVVDSASAGSESRADQSVTRDTDYFYRVTAVGPGGITPALSVTGPVRATSQWINQTRWSVLILMVLFFGFVLFFISQAQAGKVPFVRRIPGIDAIEEAIGRATEMGRPVLYVPGILDIDEIQTVAGLVILESVARLTAKYETPIVVPVTYPIPFTIAEEMVKSGYLHAGRPEGYDPNSVRFVSPEQFAYTAAVGGIMLRDRPAAHIFMGAFYAESLLLAETGFQTGAIQVAGTANVHQLPFFVVACDYTLIGEELYAASAYLSKEPKLVGALKGADLMKITILILVLLGCILETANIHVLTNLLQTQ
ncbi:MAG TPA: fibronectin type III domain-containing protein [Candidatus Eisenbacteria bacterium]|nr:fibronectin type III domain-containing protein [Candidatus Eisenbacteria bacterium]